jgi:hypothetical protein
MLIKIFLEIHYTGSEINSEQFIKLQGPVFEASSWNPEIHMVVWIWYVMSVFASALSLPKIGRMSKGCMLMSCLIRG